MIMFRLRKIHLLFFLLIIFGFSTKSIAQINYDNVTFECTFDKKPKNLLMFQIHKKQSSRIVFEGHNLIAISVQETQDRITWSYKMSGQKKPTSKYFQDSMELEIKYIYFKKNGKINLENLRGYRKGGRVGVWGTCKVKENTLLNVKKELPNNKVISTKSLQTNSLLNQSHSSMNYDNVTFECTIGGKMQIHKKTPSGIYFQKRNLKSIKFQETGDRITWNYLKTGANKLEGKYLNNARSKHYEFLQKKNISYTYFKKNGKINLDTWIGKREGSGVWGTCKVRENKLLNVKKDLPSNKVISSKPEKTDEDLTKEERIKELENKLALLQAEKKQQKNKATQNEIGSGFYVSKFRHIVTNQHVVNQCRKITVGDSMSTQIPADLIASDKRNDLAILQTISMEMASADTKSFVQNLSIQIVPIVSGGLIRVEDVKGGEQIYVAGFPHGNMISDSMRLLPGLVNSTMGFENDITQFETDAVIRKGNSGGPVYDINGNIVGVAVKRFNVTRTDNYNFAIKGSTVKQFLDAHNILTTPANRTSKMTSTKIYNIAFKQTVMVVCHR